MTHKPGCTGKRKWPSEDAADAALGHIWSQCKPGRRLETRSYPCDHCGKWHLTSQPAQPSKEDTAA